MTTRSRLPQSSKIAATTGLVLLAISACGGSSGSGSGSTSVSGSSTASPSAGSSTVEWTAAPAGYVEAGGVQLPSQYPAPSKNPAAGCKIGYISPTNAIPGIMAEVQGIKNTAEKYGCTVVLKDGQLNPQSQVTGMQSLLSEGVAAIILNPLVVGALAAPIQQANAQKVPVITVDSPASPDGQNVAGTASDILQSRDVTAYAAAKAIADTKPGAKVGLLYPAFPAGNLQYQVERFQYWAQKLGLTVAGRGDVANDTPEAGSQATNALLQKNRDIQAIMAYNDTAAAAAIAAARTLGRDDVVATGINGEQGVVGLVQQGRVLMTWAYDNVRMGEEEGKAAIAASVGDTIPTKVTAPGAIVDQANVASYKPQG